jgi:hypothetical protein
MKKIFAVCCAISSICGLNAQNVLNTIAVPEIGTDITYSFRSDNSMTPGGTGIDQTWDFSSIAYTVVEDASYLTPSTTAGASLYTSSDLATKGFYQYVKDVSQGQVTTGLLQYYSVGTTSMEFWGQYVNNFYYTSYSNSSQVLTLPMSFNGQITDAFAGITVEPTTTFPFSLTYTISNASSTTTYDGFGTLITNYGTYNDVARIKYSAESTETSGSIVRTQNTDLYYWISTTSGEVLYIFIHIATTPSGGTAESAKLVLSYDIESTVSSLIRPFGEDMIFTASPNPTTDQISFDTKHLETGVYNLSIVDDKGMVVSERNISVSPGNSVEMNVSHLKEGIYIANFLGSAGGGGRCKFVKNK